MWHDRRASIVPIARLAAVLIGAAVVLGYVTAGDEGAVAAKPTPAHSLEPAPTGTLRLRDVAVPEELKAPPRPQRSNQRSDDSGEPSPSQREPARPSGGGGGGGFDSVG